MLQTTHSFSSLTGHVSAHLPRTYTRDPSSGVGGCVLLLRSTMLTAARPVHAVAHSGEDTASP